MGILSVLGRKSAVVEEIVEEVVEQEPQPTGPYLAVLEPDVAGISSFRLRFFPRSGQAEDFVASLRPDARHGTHAFWAMHDRPTPQEGMHIEALVLVRTHEYSDVVYVVSFLDIESAQSFTRFEVKRGLSLGNVLIYWAAFTQVREELNSVSILPAAAPAPLPPGYAPPEEPSAVVQQAEATAEQYEEQIESIIPEFQAPSVENATVLVDPPVETVAPEPMAPIQQPEPVVVDEPAVPEPASATQAPEAPVIPEARPEPGPAPAIHDTIIEDTVVVPEPALLVPSVDAPAPPPIEPQPQTESVPTETELENVTPVAEPLVAAPPITVAPDPELQPEQEPDTEVEPFSGAPIDSDEDSLDQAYVFRHSSAPEEDAGRFEPAPPAPVEGDAVGAIAYVQPAPDPFTDAAVDPDVRENSCYAEVTEGIPAMEQEVQISAEVGVAEETPVEEASPASASAIAIQEMAVGRTLISEGADVGMIVDIGEKTNGAVISFRGDDEMESRQRISDPLPPEASVQIVREPRPMPQATAVAEHEPPSSQTATQESFDAEREVTSLLKNRRWESKDSPFDGFNSPPGRF